MSEKKLPPKQAILRKVGEIEEIAHNLEGLSWALPGDGLKQTTERLRHLARGIGTCTKMLPDKDEEGGARILFRRRRGLPVPLIGPVFTRRGGERASVIGSDCRIPGAPAMRRVRGRGPAGARLASWPRGT